MSLQLTKSDYVLGVQCLKMLWLKNFREDEYDEAVTNQSILDVGREVGNLAKGLFGAYSEISVGDIESMIEETNEKISNNIEIIAEATFDYNGLLCRVDILRNLGNMKLEIYEVKSSTEIKDIYYDDASYQYYVPTQLGYEVSKVHIVHINNEYVRFGDLDLKQLFKLVDVTADVLNLVPVVERKLADISSYLEMANEPHNDIGDYCFDPYDCGFFGYCTSHIPKPNVFNVAGLRLSNKLVLYDQGIISFAELYASNQLKDKQHRQVEHEIYDLATYINRQEIRAFLNQLSYPIYFLDFESIQPAIPLYDGSSPYQQIPFQYSLHYIEEEGGELRHEEYLAYPEEDPRIGLVQKLCEDIPRDVCVLAYNMGFEKGVIQKLAQIYPQYESHLMNMHDNMQDLMVPFQRHYYYTKAMKGSYSIKYVLPALFPDDPQLDYSNLEGVHNGMEASNTFLHLVNMDEKKQNQQRKYLLEYCKLDTYAMVKIWEKLKEAVG